MKKKKAIDTTNESPAYWEKILRSEGLGMDRGLHPLVYVGDTNDLDNLCSGWPVTIVGHYGTVHKLDGDEE